jgi:hypothetical protein
MAGAIEARGIESGTGDLKQLRIGFRQSKPTRRVSFWRTFTNVTWPGSESTDLLRSNRFCGKGTASNLSVELTLTTPLAHSFDNACHGHAFVGFVCECLLPESSVVLDQDRIATDPKAHEKARFVENRSPALRS